MHLIYWFDSIIESIVIKLFMLFLYVFWFMAQFSVFLLSLMAQDRE